jgi:hypothetical protein
MKKLYALAFVLVLLPLGSVQAGLFKSNKKTVLPPGLPKKWDRKIPIPPGAVVSSVKPPSGIVQVVEFKAPGDFDSLVNFYKTELPKAGFQLGPQVKAPARKAYNLNFSKASVQNTVAISPDTEDPAKYRVRVVYEVPSTRRHLVKLLLDRWRVWPRFWRSEKPPTQPVSQPAGDSAGAPPQD